MRSKTRSGLVGLLALLAVPTLAFAQKKPIELGIDAGVSLEVNDPKTTSISIPTSVFRVGFFLGERLSLEPSVSFNWAKTSDQDAVTLAQLRLGLLYHFQGDLARSRVFLEPIVGINYIDLGGGDGASQVHLGGGIGIKLPAPNHIGLRLQALYAHGFANDDFVSNDVIALLIGFSFYTH